MTFNLQLFNNGVSLYLHCYSTVSSRKGTITPTWGLWIYSRILSPIEKSVYKITLKYKLLLNQNIFSASVWEQINLSVINARQGHCAQSCALLRICASCAKNCARFAHDWNIKKMINFKVHCDFFLGFFDFFFSFF